MPSDNNDLVNRPFADLQERMAEVERLKTDEFITSRREVDYRAICNYLNSEIFHLISSVDDPQVKAWARKIVTKLHDMVGKDILKPRLVALLRHHLSPISINKKS